jgi:hypothetical protein
VRVWPAILLLVGCNRIFGIAETGQTPPPDAIDAAYFDAPADAPFACPPTGETPTFSRLLNQIVQTCADYSPSTMGRAVGYCLGTKYQLAEGPVDGELVPIADFAEVDGTHLDLARYAPEGDELFVRVWLESSVFARIVVYRPSGGTFVADHDITLPAAEPIDSFVRFGAPSRGPLRRMMIRNTGQDYQEIEVDATGASTSIGTYTAGDLGAASLIGLPPNMSPDGLRIVFLASDASVGTITAYADRATINDRFSKVRILDGVPRSDAPFMTENCGRVYFTALGYVFWVQRS